MSANTVGKKAALRRRKTKEGSTCSSASVAGNTATLRTTLAPNAPWYTKEQLEAKPPPKPRAKRRPKPAPQLLKPKPKESWGNGLEFLTWTTPRLRF